MRSSEPAAAESARPTAPEGLVGSAFMSVFRSILLFTLAALAEIGGA
ncbi:hypothetical protein [Nocardia testacea]